MILLDSRFCGYDLSVIGFPSVETCMAVVVETRDWLVGWHAMNTGSTSLENDATAFGTYIGKQGPSEMINLYGVTHQSRFAGKGEMETQLTGIAERVGFRGKIRCFIMPDRRKPQQDYVEFKRRGPGSLCEVSYIDQLDIGHQSQEVVPSKTRHQQIVGGKTVPLTTETTTEKQATTVGSATSPIRTTVDLKGNLMAVVADKDWIKFKA